MGAWAKSVGLVAASLGAGVVVLLGSGCGDSETDTEDTWEPIGKHSLPAVSVPLGSVPCTIQVRGIGEVPLESDYLPHVVMCEGGDAPLDTLKAQAIAARTVAFYYVATKGSICNGERCQVYRASHCDRTPSSIHQQAVQQTEGLYLSYDNLLTYGFYVDGDHTPSSSTCQGDTVTATERRVTYNEGKTGPDVTQTTLGYVGPPGFGQNRGCMGQWSARCLSNTMGYTHSDILQFFYGDDIQVLDVRDSGCDVPVEEPDFGCIKHEECAPGVCAWMGEGYCCRHGGFDGKTCFSDRECASGQVCAYNGDRFVCASPVACSEPGHPQEPGSAASGEPDRPASDDTQRGGEESSWPEWLWPGGESCSVRAGNSRAPSPGLWVLALGLGIAWRRKMKR